MAITESPFKRLLVAGARLNQHGKQACVSQMIAGRSTSLPISSATAGACASWWSVDDCTCECLALVADTSISGIRVARELDRLLIEHGK
jgi:hypothetical protein